MDKTSRKWDCTTKYTLYVTNAGFITRKMSYYTEWENFEFSQRSSDLNCFGICGEQKLNCYKTKLS
jgi:hypothetical protein